MGWISLACRTACRKPWRLVLLAICVAVAFLIFGLTASFRFGSQGTEAASDEVLGVMSAGGPGQRLPLALLPQLEAMPGVAAVGIVARLRGYVGTTTNAIAVSAADPARLSQVSGAELGLTPELLAGLGASRDHVLIGQALARAQGWEVGQSITLTAFDTAITGGGLDWRFRIAGIFEGASPATDTWFVIARYDYVNAMRARGRDQVDAFVIRPAPDMIPARLAQQIDALFANSAHPTRSQSEKQFLEAFLRQFADTGLIITLVVGASFVTLLLIVINTLLLALRERRFEIGVLKTLGVPPGRIFALILGETLFIFLPGGLFGLGLAKLGTLLAGPALGLVLGPQVMVHALVLMVALGLVSGLIPAIGALRIPVTAALRTR